MTESGQAIIAILLLLWGAATTAAGLYLSYINNFKQNTRIIELLECISEGINNTKTVSLDELDPNKKEEEVVEYKLRVPEWIYRIFGGR